MLKVLQREDWIAKVEKIRPLMLNEQSVVIDVLCKSNNLKAVYFLLEKKNKVVISFIALANTNSIKLPFHFFYSPLWIDLTLTDTQYCQYLDEFIAQLCIDYNNIVIKLPMGMTDVRPFLWRGFSVINYYTYLKKLNQLHYHYTTEKNIKKASNAGYECREEDVNQENLNLNLQIFKDLKAYSSSKINQIQDLLSLMNDESYLSSFNCYKDGKLIASNLIFLDNNYKIAYTVLLNRIPRTNKDDVHSLLHDFFFNKLKEEGYEYVDLLGGDMQGIAPFKSRFNAELRPHFQVSYNKNAVRIERTIRKSKDLVKKLIAKLS